MSTPKGEATKRRILDAASAEFAERGIAGARVDRIAAEAQSNKSQMYSYFGSKDALFDAAYAEHIGWMVNSVPLRGDDLPGYAVALYDAYLARPDIVRLTTWARLERRPAGDLYDDGTDHNRLKIDAIREGQRAGSIDPTLDPHDVLSLVTAMSMSWSPASPLIAASASEPEELHARRREALASTVARAFSPG
ncbi:MULTISPECIES: TetR family transcriptional regulator [Microbacterium]|uniref:TetR/AcrR family transcriptional regulator n=1 Tax=Microbacterium wangchenii TaxID=2541726 RepID=A0ABX5SRK6_9MICO|nr:MULTISPECIES: TetR family transcriptional regulator [Microbacterium]MCK6068227.1 TetR family transcriptional regulator [Microbacterium sp. EYE_512]QBR87514.1 TetR/AcrR family transcriptional regulator [Microbacterium wangchenii]TFV84421.1 TetR/AcrR family transcriptional regulator [Microbacterium sp. dk485]TXK15782.1 TetR/AcrR family transcriptional regulator [Microbacterium wangchenii]